MKHIERYKKYFTKEYMMGPNALRLLGEIVEDNPEATSGGHVLDLGCGDALSLPFAQEYFDSVVSVDTYHYFGCEEKVFAEKILPFMKKGGFALFVVPGLKEAATGEMKVLMDE